VGRCTWQGAVQNTGSGCAGNVTGVVQFQNASGQTIGSSHQLLFLMAAGHTLRPNEVIQVQSVTTVDRPTADAVRTYTLQPSWTNVACQ
jgi:hypothetical protein